MSQLSKADFESKYNNASTGLYRAGQSRGIGSDDHRALVTDIKDSAVFITDLIASGKLIIDCGTCDLSGGNMPTTGGTGTSGAIARGNQFDVATGGTVSGEAIPTGATIRALVDTPGNTLSNWRIYF